MACAGSMAGWRPWDAKRQDVRKLNDGVGSTCYMLYTHAAMLNLPGYGLSDGGEWNAFGTVRTRGGALLECAVPREPAPETVIAQLAADRANHPGLTPRSVDWRYNCMGLVFAARRSCIDIDELEKALKGDYYEKVNRDEVVEGDLVVYFAPWGRPVHVGVVLNRPGPRGFVGGLYGDGEIRVLSKWGEHAEYVHSERDVDAVMLGEIRYYSERRINP